MSETRLDRVFTFGDQLSFLIPHEWIEADEESDAYLYHAPHADSGWLRVSLITVKDLKTSCRDRLLGFLKERARKESGELYESGENIVVAWERPSEQDGVLLYLYWWSVGHCHGSSLAREAMFSYTILRERRDDPDTQSTVSLIAELVANSRFTEPKIV